MEDDPVLAHAISCRNAAEAEFRRWDDFINQYREVRSAVSGQSSSGALRGASAKTSAGHIGSRAGAYLHAASAGSAGAIATLEDSHIVPKTRETAYKRPGRMAETEFVAREIILELGRPVPTRELLERLEARGIQVGGRDPPSTLSARLSRAQSVVGERGSGWKLRDEQAQTNEAAAPHCESEAAASETPEHAVERGEVAHDNMTT